MNPTREQAWQTLTRYTKSEALLRHGLAVEASTAWYARKLGEDEELWRVTALLHDFDYEIHPTLDKHPQDGAAILREEGYPEEVIEAILSHANHLSMPRDTPLKKALFACDELSGFVHACGLVRPDGIATLEPKSVRKKLKQPSFAAGVHRDEVYAGAELLGLDLDQHIANVIEAILSHAEHLSVPRDTPLKKTLFACDELAGFIHACGLVRPDGIATLEPKSVKKKLKQSSFAAKVHREDVYNGAEELGVDLDEHIAFVVEALRPIAGELGLRTAAA